MNEQAITITDTEIQVLLQYFIHRDYSITHKELLIDVLANHYSPDKIIRLRCGDGENIYFSGFADFIEELCELFNIPKKSILFETHGDSDERFSHRKLMLGIFVASKKIIRDFNKDLTGSKFVGTTIGRYSPLRFRLVYELDREFPNDNYTVFQPTVDHVNNSLRAVSNIYRDELSWMSTKTFDKDILTNMWSGCVSWYDALPNYGNIWNNYKIEIISETDSHSNFWFTEKTARCLATGKPFVILAGKGSLKTLREFGFKTYGDIIDESYDEYESANERIKRLLFSLKMLYNDENREQKLQHLYEIASDNSNIYDDFIKSHKEYD